MAELFELQAELSRHNLCFAWFKPAELYEELGCLRALHVPGFFKLVVVSVISFVCLFILFFALFSFIFFFLAQISCLIKPFCTNYIQMLLSVQKQLSASVWKPLQLIVKGDQKRREYAFSTFTSTLYAS